MCILKCHNFENNKSYRQLLKFNVLITDSKKFAPQTYICFKFMIQYHKLDSIQEETYKLSMDF